MAAVARFGADTYTQTIVFVYSVMFEQ